MVVNKGYKQGSLTTVISYSWLCVNGSVWLNPAYAKLHAFWRLLLQESGDIVFVLIHVRHNRVVGMEEEPADALKAFVREVAREVASIPGRSERVRQYSSGAL